MKLRLSDSAKADIEAIRTYTIDNFGVRQWLVYSGALEEGLAALARFPDIGRSLDELPVGYRAFRVREHWICYRICENAIEIDGVVKYTVLFHNE